MVVRFGPPGWFAHRDVPACHAAAGRCPATADSSPENHLMRTRKPAISVLLLALAACGETGDGPTAFPERAPDAAMLISDGAHAGTPGFYFLAPLVPAPAFGGAFAPNLYPVAHIYPGTTCEGSGWIAAFNGSTGAAGISMDLAGESYGAVWLTKQASLSTEVHGADYRLCVRVGEQLLGYADIDVVRSNRDLRDVPDGFVGLVSGKPLSVKFRIETGVVAGAPDATDDPAYTVGAGETLTEPAPAVLDNDDLGTPTATLTHFGGGSLGGDPLDNAAGATIDLGSGGSLAVNADGSFAFTPAADFTGAFTFEYRIANSIGFDIATVTVDVTAAAAPPVARADAFSATVGNTLNGNVLADNGSGADLTGSPAATVISFGGGSLGGDVTSNAAGATVAVAGGTITVDATGALSLVGATQATFFTFQYRLQNTTGFSDATVTVSVGAGPRAPTAVADAPAANSAPTDAFHTAFETTLDSDAHATPGLLANDDAGYPAAALASFGGGDLGGVVTDITAGSTVSTGGHQLTVHGNGRVVFAPATGFTGLFSFSYRITNGTGSSDATATIAVGIRPAAGNDTYAPPGATILGNVPFNTAASTNFSVLGNDAGDALVLQSTIGSPTGGTFSLATGTGTFAWTPAAGHTGAAGFTYTVGNGFGNVTGTVSFSVAGRVWFVSSTLPANGTGTQDAPFNCLTDTGCASGALGTGDAAFLFAGAYTGGLTLPGGARLIGQGASASLASVLGVTPTPDATLPSTGAVAPTITTTATATNGINLGANNTLRGFTVGNTTGVGISGSGFGTLGVSELEIGGTGQALDLSNGALGGTGFRSISVNGGGHGIVLTNVTGTLAVTGTGTTAGSGGTLQNLSGAGAGPGLLISNGAGSLTATFNNVTVQNVTDDAVRLRLSNAAVATVTFDNLRVPGPTGQDGVDVGVANTATGNVTIRNSLLERSGAGSGGIVLNAIDQAGGGWHVTNTTVRNNNGPGITARSTATANPTLVVRNTVVDCPGGDGSVVGNPNGAGPCQSADGLLILQEANGTMQTALDANSVQRSRMGIVARALGGTGRLDILLKSNSVSTPPLAMQPAPGIWIETGSTADANTLCLAIGTPAAGSNSSTGAAGGPGYALRERTGTTFLLQGILNGSNAAQVQSFVQGSNTGTVSVDGTSFDGATCTTPPLP